MGIGIRDGRQIGQVLDMAYNWVLMDPRLNDREILIDRLKAL